MLLSLLLHSWLFALITLPIVHIFLPVGLPCSKSSFCITKQHPFQIPPLLKYAVCLNSITLSGLREDHFVSPWLFQSWTAEITISSCIISHLTSLVGVSVNIRYWLSIAPHTGPASASAGNRLVHPVSVCDVSTISKAKSCYKVNLCCILKPVSIRVLIPRDIFLQISELGVHSVMSLPPLVSCSLLKLVAL